MAERKAVKQEGGVKRMEQDKKLKETLQSIDDTLKRIEESLSELSSLKIDYAKLANSINLRSVQLDQSLLGRRIQSST